MTKNVGEAGLTSLYTAHIHRPTYAYNGKRVIQLGTFDIRSTTQFIKKHSKTHPFSKWDFEFGKPKKTV